MEGQEFAEYISIFVSILVLWVFRYLSWEDLRVLSQHHVH